MPRRKPKSPTEAFLGPSVQLGVLLQNLRRAQGATQAELARQLDVGQTALSHMEQRDDLLLSTLVKYVAALGGTIQVAATFPDLEPILLSGDAMWQPISDTSTEPQNSTGEQLWLPEIVRPEEATVSKDVVFSIRPPHAQKILEGKKTVELRRRFAEGVQPGTLALIYATSPTQALTGSARIEDVQRLTISDIWERHRAAACLRKGDFEAYFSGLDQGYAIVLSSARPLTRPVGLSELRERFGFAPPQSYQYASPYMRTLIEHEQPQTPH